MIDRYLANENVPATIVEWLRQQGNDVVHAAETLVGQADETLLDRARAEDRILLTFDRDFGELVHRQRQPPAPGIVLFRLRRQPPGVVVPFMQTFFSTAGALRGYFTVAAPGQYRQSPLVDTPNASGTSE